MVGSGRERVYPVTAGNLGISRHKLTLLPAERGFHLFRSQHAAGKCSMAMEICCVMFVKNSNFCHQPKPGLHIPWEILSSTEQI